MNNEILKSSTATYQSGVAKADGKFYVCLLYTSDAADE